MLSESNFLDKDFLDDEEPSVLSADPYERKLARRLRIQKRAEALQKLDGDDNNDVTEESLTEKQILASAELLEKLVVEGNEVISNVRVANDAREIERRVKSSEIRKELLRRLDDNAELCREEYDSISERWIAIYRSNDPLAINMEMELQKDKCDRVLAQKDAIIMQLKQELQRMDREYFDDQIKQKEDISLLIERIENQMSSMENFYTQELNLIKKMLKSENDALVNSYRNKWDALYKQQETEDLLGNEKRNKIMKEYEEEMEKVMREHEEEYRAQKIHLEKECQALQQQVERTKALCQLNGEKLAYNLTILKNREEENSIVKSQQKRMINKYQTLINNLKKNYSDLEENTTLEIEKLSGYILKTHNNIMELKEKASHFTHVNEKQYLSIWEMNTENANDLVKKILEADEIIYTRILGILWDPPIKSLPRKEDLPSYCKAVNNIKKRQQEEIEKLKVYKIDKTERTPSELKLQRKLFNNILKQISKCSGFLIEDKLIKLISNYNDDEKTIISLDNVFQALSISTAEEINILLDFFLPYAFCSICSAAEDTSSENLTKSSTSSEASTCLKTCEGCKDDNMKKFIESIKEEVGTVFQSSKKLDTSSLHDRSHSECLLNEEYDIKSDCGRFKRQTKKYTCDKGHILDIQAVHVTKAMKDIVTKLSIAEQKEMLSFEEQLREKKYTISRNLSIEDVKYYWYSYQDIFSSQKEKLWDAILVGLNKYYEVLRERHKLCNEIEGLNKQNSELQRLLESHTKSLDDSLSLLQMKSTKHFKY